MSECKTVKVDSNVVGLAITEEKCLGELPEASNQVWVVLEPNSYSDFGGNLDTVAREPISPSRQNKKGTPTDISVSAGFNTDITQDNMLDLLQGVFFADKEEKTVLDVTATTATDYTVAKDGTKFKTGNLLLATGFKDVKNNGLKKVVSSTATGVKVDTLTTGSNAGKIRIVGHEFTNADVKFTVVDKTYSLTSTTAKLNEFGLKAGEWIFVGGDEEGHSFANVKPFYARIRSVAEKEIVFDDGTYPEVSATDQGTGKTIRIYFGTVIMNQPEPSKIKRRSYTLERSLGTVAGKVQGQYVRGAVFGEFNMSVGQGEMLKADLSFTATDVETYNGDKLKSDTTPAKKLPALGQEGFNTTQDIRSIRLSIVEDKSVSRPLFAYLTELSLEINNNLSENKAIGVMGAIDVSAGNFQVSGNVGAYFQDVSAIDAVRRNVDVGLHVIFAKSNKGFMFDVPLIGLGGGEIKVEKDNPITNSLEINGAENELGYTLMYINFHYLPTSAM